MERRFELRKEAMPAECGVPPEVFRGVEDRLVKSFTELLTQPAQQKRTQEPHGRGAGSLNRAEVGRFVGA